jgi:protein-disulfide isomerase
VRVVLFVVMLFALCLPARAEPLRPLALDGRADVFYEGVMGGLHIWRVDGDPRVWALAPDGVSVLRGELLGPSAQRALGSTSAPGPTLEGAALPAADPVAELAASGVDLGDVIARLDAAPDEVKAGLLAGLVEALKSTETREAYIDAVATWRALALAELEDAAPAQPQGQRPANPPQEQASSAEGEAVTTGSEDIPDLDARSGALLEEARRAGLWFGLGRAGAPTVYALMDPTCPYCAKAMEALEPRLKAGDIDLRILLTPVLSERAVDLSAGLLLAPDPAAAFLDHELRVARTGRSALEAKSFADLPDHLADGLRTNHGIVVDNDIPGVPFFLFETPEGPRWTFGVPTAESFLQARPDPFLGDVTPPPRDIPPRPGG